MSRLKFLRKAAKEKPHWVTFNVPEPGYVECNGCYRAQMSEGLCDDCASELEKLEHQSSPRDVSEQEEGR